MTQMRLPWPVERPTMPVYCGHDDRKHYAKGKCLACYHKAYRIEKPMVVAMAQERYQAKRGKAVICPNCDCLQDAPAGVYERGPTDDCPDRNCPCHDYAAMVTP